jgi:hypothetical protein
MLVSIRAARPIVTETSYVARCGHPQSSEHLIVQTKNNGLVGILARTEFCEHTMKKFFSEQDFSKLKSSVSSSVNLQIAA